MMPRSVNLLVPEFLFEEYDAVAGPEAFITVALKELCVIIPCGIIDHPLEHIWAVCLLNLDVEDTPVLPLASQVKDCLLPSVIVWLLFAVAIMSDVLDSGIVRQNMVESLYKHSLVGSVS